MNFILSAFSITKNSKMERMWIVEYLGEYRNGRAE
jgi:hypothetical protein